MCWVFLCRFFSEKELNERVIVASSTISSLGHVNSISLHNHIWRDWSVILSHPQHTPRPHTAFSLPWSVNQIKALLFTSILLGFRPTSEYLMRIFWSFACYSVMSFRLISSNLCQFFHISKVWKKYKRLNEIKKQNIWFWKIRFACFSVIFRLFG